MPEFDAQVETSLESTFDEVWEHHREHLKPSVFEELDDHLGEVNGTNRGQKSTASTTARKGGSSDTMSIKLQNDASFRITCHELGHVLMDAFGYDCTQEATNRANNKSNYTRWPQFSFGKKDSPCERFMFRRYDDLDDLPTMEVETFDDLDGRSDFFWIDGHWYEADTYGYAPDRRETKRFQDPMIRRGSKCAGIEVKQVSGYTSRDVRDTVPQPVNRYLLTPGLAGILGEEEPNWSGMEELLRQVNGHWYEAITLVRKRGSERERGQNMAPQGKRSSYYVMNAHEFFTETHASMMRLLNGDTTGNRYVTRLKEYCPGLIEAYDKALLEKSHSSV